MTDNVIMWAVATRLGHFLELFVRCSDKRPGLIPTVIITAAYLVCRAIFLTYSIIK